MSASDSEPEENFCFFGKPLAPYDEDSFPKRKPIAVEDQIATDEHGRRRFHGAFTGGFSAGFFNTVGSLEGWTPSDFKSSRDEKASKFKQRPEDFMDDEDLGEHGIAPQTVRATTDYSTAKKCKKQGFSEGPIPGEPVLETLLTSGNETVGYLLLKNLGIKDKINKRDEEMRSMGKVYGCQMPIHYKVSESIEEKQYEVPEIYKDFLTNPKSNTFGLGYKGLDRSHVNLFKSSNLVVRDKNNKKFSIAGQAFGVGAFEIEDDDIYTKEDMNNYDFELTKEKKTDEKQNHADLVYGFFRKSKKPLNVKLSIPLPTIPHSFSGKHKVKKSRFEPLQEEQTSRNEINPSIRARYLGENDEKIYTKSRPIVDTPSTSTSVQEEPPPRVEPKKEFDVSSLLISDRFVSASTSDESSENVSKPVRQADSTHGTEQMRAAVKMKMFGPLTRISSDWQPCALLCKRFNVPEPFAEQSDNKNRKRTKNVIFQSQKFDDEITSLVPGISQDPSPLESTSIKQEQILDESHNLESSAVDSNIGTTDNNHTETLENTETAVIDITDKIDIAEKTDLFKAVFLSSSESEDEKEEDSKEDKEKAEAFKNVVLSEPLIPKIKPLKQGILSDVGSHIFTKPVSDDKIVEDKIMLNSSPLQVDLTQHANNSNQIVKESDRQKSEDTIFNDNGKFDKTGVETERKDKHRKKKKEKHKKRDRSRDFSDSDEEKVKKHKKNKHKKKERHKHDHKSKKKSRY